MNITPRSRDYEYAAFRFLLQWERKEARHHEALRAKPNASNIRSALSAFKVSRNFPQLEEKILPLCDGFLKIDAKPKLQPPDRVVELANFLEELFERENLSAASKLLWLRRRDPYVIYDRRAVTGLQKLDPNFNPAGYRPYFEAWNTAYASQETSIRAAAQRLPEATDFLAKTLHGNDRAARLSDEPWFLRRIFDIYLWEIGGEG